MIRLALRVRRADAESVLAELLALAPNGVEESEDGDVVEYAVYGAPGELPELPDLRAAAGEAFVEVVSREIPDDWYDGWQRFHRPITIGERLHVRPPWEPARDDLLDIVIDPGQAFGTGSHDTTRMCLELLLELVPGGALVDLGCGSGVLGIAAARLGWSPVVAIDHEAAAVEATLANAAANGVTLDARRLDLRREPPPNAPVVVANLVGPLLHELASRLPEARPRALVASGLLRAEAGEVGAKLAAGGGRIARRVERGEWAALLVTWHDQPA